MAIRFSSTIKCIFAIWVLLGAQACGPYFYTMHAYLMEVKPGFQVIKELALSARSPGRAVIHRPRLGLPLEISYTGPKFFITMKTNVSHEAFLMVNIKSNAKMPLVIRSNQLRYLFPNYYDASELQYDDFGLKRGKGEIELTVVTDCGVVIWQQHIKYEIVKCGYIYGIETI